MEWPAHLPLEGGGGVSYAMLCTRPDVSYTLSMTTRYQSDLGESHWTTVKNKYTNASFQFDKDDFKSQSGFVFCLNGGTISLKSSKQDTVADSTTEA